MTGELRQETAEKLHPILRLVLRAFKTFRDQSESNELLAACAGLVTNLLYAIQDFPQRQNFQRLPIRPSDRAVTSFGILRNEVAKFAPCIPETDDASRKALAAVPNIFDDFSAKRAVKFCLKIHREASQQGKACAGPIAKAIRSCRSNRNPEGAFRKVSHWMLLVSLFPFGILKGTKSEHSLQGPLSLEELREIFDYACPACHESHSSEALRKSAVRFKAYILRNWPSDSIRGNRSPSGKIRIRMTGPHRLNQIRI